MVLSSICQFFSYQPTVYGLQKIHSSFSKWSFREQLCFHYIILLTLHNNIHLDLGHGLNFLILSDSSSSPQMQTYIGNEPPLIISHYFPSSFSMFLTVWSFANC